MSDSYKNAVYLDLLDCGLTEEKATEFVDDYYETMSETWGGQLNSEDFALRMIDLHRSMRGNWWQRQPYIEINLKETQ